MEEADQEDQSQHTLTKLMPAVSCLVPGNPWSCQCPCDTAAYVKVYIHTLHTMIYHCWDAGVVILDLAQNWA
jgi:hypothetical protein